MLGAAGLAQPASDAAALAKAEQLLDCGTEACVLTNPKFRKFAGAVGVPVTVLDHQLEVRFKPAGPRDSTALLSNYNIDDTLQRWAREFLDFYACPFAMMDFAATREAFETLDMGDVMCGRARLNLGAVGTAVRHNRTFGCVLNTDVSTGAGKHWVAVFVDCRPAPAILLAPPTPAQLSPDAPVASLALAPQVVSVAAPAAPQAQVDALAVSRPAPGSGPLPWTVEYFDSAGNPPPREVVAWMGKTRKRLVELRASLTEGACDWVESVPVTTVEHQQSRTECGLYSLYYIRRRLEGVGYGFFESDKSVPDSAMVEFRRHCFRA